MKTAVSFDVGTKNLGFCKLNIYEDTKKFEVIDWATLSVVDPSVNVNKTSIENLTIPFTKEVQKVLHDWLDFATIVYIESQPMGRTKNVKTKILSHILQILCYQENPDIEIHFVHPSLKLKDMVGPRDYKLNKKYAIEKTMELIQDPNVCLTMETCIDLFVGQKKDDLADAFLQGYYAGCLASSEKRAINSTKSFKKRSTKKRKKCDNMDIIFTSDGL